MANTLKLGAGKWATGKDTVLSFNDENGNFKPLPFSFSRASSATVVNQSGLIETVGSGEPRIDFLGNTKGALKLEPQRTNYLPYSNKFTSWSSTNSTLIENAIVSPDGTLNATKITDNSVSGNHRVITNTTTPSSGNATYSIFVKKGTMKQCFLNMFSNGTIANVSVDLENGSISSGTGVSQSIESYGNDWYKVSITGVLADTNTYVYMYMKQIGAYVGAEDNMFMYGAQLEVGNYPTSIIPTSGSAVTRVADTCSQTVPDGIIGQTEGTVYADVNFVGVTEAITNQIFFIREENSNNGYLFAGFYQGKLNVGLKVSGSTKFDLLFGGSLSKGSYKIAVGYSSGNTKVFINGSQVGSTMTQTFGVNNFFQILLTGSAGTNQLGNVNRDFKVYNTRLTDQELIALTQ